MLGQQADATTTLDLFTLGVAMAGAVTGIVALIVQAVFFRRSGPSIRAELRWAWVHASRRVVITKPIDRPLAGPPEPGYDLLLLAVRVRNRGRAATTVEEVGVNAPGGFTVSHPDPPFGPSPGQRVEAESSETWYVDAHAVLAAAEAAEVEPRVGGVVTLGSGRQHRTPRVLLRVAADTSPN